MHFNFLIIRPTIGYLLFELIIFPIGISRLGRGGRGLASIKTRQIKFDSASLLDLVEAIIIDWQSGKQQQQ